MSILYWMSGKYFFFFYKETILKKLFRLNFMGKITSYRYIHVLLANNKVTDAYE